MITNLLVNKLRNYYGGETNIWTNTFDTNMRKSRKDLGISAQKLAEAIGTSRTRITEIECQRAKISYSEIKKIADVLNTDAEYIAQGLLIRNN